MRTRAVVWALCVAAGVALGAPSGALGFRLVSSFGLAGSGAGQMLVASGIAVAPDGTAYVADYANHRVSVFSSDGTFIRAFGKGVNPAGGDVCTTASGCKEGAETGVAGGLDTPFGVDLGPGETLYLPDFGNNRVDVFAADGTFLRAFGKGVNPSGGNVCTTASGCKQGEAGGSAGAIDTPTGVGIDSAAGTVYVASAANRVNAFTIDGTFIRAFGKGVNPAGGDVCTATTGCQAAKESGGAGGMSHPWDVAVGSGGQIAVSDGNNNRIDVFAADGTFVRAFGRGVNATGDLTKVGICTTATGCRKGTEGGAGGAFAGPTGSVVDGAGNLVVADMRNNRIVEATFDGAFLRGIGEGVIDGDFALQICTPATGCRAGISSSNLGGVASPFATALDCTGAVYATTLGIFTVDYPQIKRFGEPAVGVPPCVAPPAAAASTSLALSPTPFAPLKSKVAKPAIRVELDRGSGTAILSVAVSEPGTLLLRGKGIRKVKRQAKRPGLVELAVVPTEKLKGKLEEMGKAPVKVSLSFKAEEGGFSSQFRSIVLKMAAPS